MTKRTKSIVIWTVAALLLAVVVSTPAIAAAKKTPTPAAASPVNINTATAKELMKLPGVGKATADKIVAGRPYASADDLAKAGISKATITKITPLIVFASESKGQASATGTEKAS
jgi:DNA uptake protein ComE-like DNA-binding protein